MTALSRGTCEWSERKKAGVIFLLMLQAQTEEHMY